MDRERSRALGTRLGAQPLPQHSSGGVSECFRTWWPSPTPWAWQLKRPVTRFLSRSDTSFQRERYLLGGWMKGRESWKKVLLGGGKSLELIASLHAVSLLKRLLAVIQVAVPFKRDFSMSSAKKYPVPNCFFASLSRLPSSELVCWLPLSCPVAQPLGAQHPPRRAPSGVEECECH